MKTLVTIIILGSLSVLSCSKNDKQQNVEPANYAETHDELIQNHEKDSAVVDSVKVPTAMPAQPPAENK